MKLIDFAKSEMSVSITVEEFNFLREALREMSQVLSRDELPTLTGFTYEKLENLQDQLRAIAEEVDVDL